ncbi:MAG: hypothetical protein ABL904_18815 [Hyphomicrobiaceae bacterium]
MFDELPAEVQDHARRAYVICRDNPSHPSLQFKRVSRAEPIYSVRIGLAHRALGLFEGDTVTWIWIGSHDEYERQLG